MIGYKSTDGKWYEIEYVANKDGNINIIFDRYIIINTEGFWNCYDIEKEKPLHYATDFNNRVMPGISMHKWGDKYPKCGFGGKFKAWLKKKDRKRAEVERCVQELHLLAQSARTVTMILQRIRRLTLIVWRSRSTVLSAEDTQSTRRQSNPATEGRPIQWENQIRQKY